MSTPLSDILSELDIAVRHHNAGSPDLAYETLTEYVVKPLLAREARLRALLEEAEPYLMSRTDLLNAASLNDGRAPHEGIIAEKIRAELTPKEPVEEGARG